MKRLSANLRLLLLLCACARPAQLVFSVPAAAPCLTGLLPVKECVVTATTEGQVQCLTAAGTARWKATVGHPVTLAPVLVGEAVVIALETSAHGLSQDDGRELWHLTSAPTRSALVSDGAAAYSLMADGGLCATGPGNEPVWQAPSETGLQLAVGDGALAVAGPASVSLLGAADGQRRWSTPVDNPKFMAMGQSLVVVATATGQLLALEGTTGHPRWQRADAQVTGPVTMGADAVWVASGTSLVGLALEDGRQLRRVELGAAVSAAVVQDGELMLAPLQGAEGCVAVIVPSKSTPATRLCADHQLKGSPVVLGDLVLLAPRDGRVLGFKLNREKLSAP